MASAPSPEQPTAAAAEDASVIASTSAAAPPPPTTEAPAARPPAPATAASEPSDFKLFKPPRTAAPSPASLPDSYFTPTAADLKDAQTALAARTQSLTNAPLQTRAMREAGERPKRDRFPNTRIRVRFMDRSQLEKTFASTDKIRAVYAFVRACLREDVQPIKFVLYQTPPLRELKVSDPQVRDLSLYDLHLAPSSVLHVKFLEDSLNHVDVPAPLSPFVLSKGEDLPPPPDFDKDPEPSSSGGKKAPTKAKSTGGTLGSSDKKVPKWLKLSKK